MQHLVNSNAESPHLCFRAIGVANVAFRGHVDRRTDV